MDRRLVAGAATVVTMVLLVLAAASGPIRLWITPPLDVAPSSIDGAGPLDTVAPREAAQPDPSPHEWGDTLLQLLAVLLIVLLVTAAAWIVRAGRFPMPGRRAVRGRRHRQITALPETPERELAVDVDAARDALTGGSPRNAIVACWMQLERDVAAAGLPRDEERGRRLGGIHSTRITTLARSNITRITATTTATMPPKASTAGRASVSARETQSANQTHTVTTARQRVM